MCFSSDLLLAPDTPKLTHSLHSNSPRFKNRLSNKNSENDNNHFSYSSTDKKLIDKNSLKNNRMIDEEILHRQNIIETLQNKIQTYNEVLEQSKKDQNENQQTFTSINEGLTELCSQLDFTNIDSEILFDKKSIQKAKIELEMLKNIKKLNHYIENEPTNQKNDQILRFRDQFINYIENDSVTEIDDSNIQEKIDQLSQLLTDFYSFFNNNKSIQIDFNSNQSLSSSPRRIPKKIKNTKPTTTRNQSSQSPKQLKSQNPFIMRPNNSKVIYNHHDHPIPDEIDNKKSQKNIKFVSKNAKPEHALTPRRDNNRSSLRAKRNQKQLQIQIDQMSIQFNNSTFSMTDDDDNSELLTEDEYYQKKLANETLNLISEPTTPTRSKNSPRNKQKRSPVPLNTNLNDEQDLPNLNQQPKVITNTDPKKGETSNKSSNSSKTKNANSGTQKPKESTDALMSKAAKGLLNAGDDGSDSEPNNSGLRDNQGTGGNQPSPNKSNSNKKKGKKRISLFDFINDIGNTIIDNFENALGKPLSRRKHPKKSDNLTLDDPETFKYSTVKADEIVGLDDSDDDSDDDNESGYSGYGYYSDDNEAGDGTSKGKDGKHVGKDGKEHHRHHGEGHRDKAKEINMNGLSKEQEEEILRQIEEGGEPPKGYTVLVEKDGKKMIVQTVYGIEDEDDDEIRFYKEALINQEIETKEWEEKETRNAKKEKINKKHRSPPEFEYELAEDEDFSPIIAKRQTKFHTVIVERDGRKFDERQRKPYVGFEYIEVDEDEKPTKTSTKTETPKTSTKKETTKTATKTKNAAKNSKTSTKTETKSKNEIKKKEEQKEDAKPKENNETFSSAQRTHLVKRFIEFELYDIESEGGTVRKCYVPLPPEIEYEWVQEKDDPTTIGKYPKQWGYKWTYGNKGKRIKVCYDKRSMVEEESRDWKGNSITIMKKVRMEAIEVDCDDGIKRTIRRPIQKVEFELFEEENDDGTFSIVKRPIIFAQLENGTWKRLDSENDFFYEQFESNGKLVLERRHKVYELVDVECDDGQIHKVKREVQPVEYEEIIDEKTGKKKIVERQARYAYVIVEDENGNKIKARREILPEEEEYEYIGSYDNDGNFTLVKQKVRYGYRYDFNGRRIRYRIPDHEIIQDEEGNTHQKEIDYEKVEVQLEDGTIVKVLRRKEDFEYVMVTDDKTGEVRYEKRKVQYETTTKIDDDGNVITVRTKVTQDYDEVEAGVDENGNIIYKKVPREYETITMKNSKGETITVKRARKYNYETVVDENGVAHQIRKEKIKPKRVRKAVKRLISFPKPLPRSKSFSYLRRYPKHPAIASKDGAGGIKPSTSISNIHQVMQAIASGNTNSILLSNFRNDKDFYRRLLLNKLKDRHLSIQVTNASIDLVVSKTRTQKVQDNIDYVLFEIRSKLPKLRLSKPVQTTIKKPPIDGSDYGAQTVITMDQLNDFHLKVKSGMLTNKQLSTLTGNVQTLADYLDKLHRDHKKAQNLIDSLVQEGDGYLATIKIYKPTPDSVAMPPETRRRMELQKSFKELEEKCQKIQADLQDAREQIFILKRKEQDQECLNTMQTNKVDKKKKVPKFTMKELKELKARVSDENKNIMSQLKLAEIEEQNLDKKLEKIIPNYSEKEINETSQKIEKMKKKITQLKKQFRTKRKIPDAQAKHSYVLSSKDEIAEFERRRTNISSQIVNSDKKEQELIDNINLMAKVMQKDNLRIPVDRLVTIFE